MAGKATGALGAETLASVPVVGEGDIRPVLQRPLDAGTEAAVGQESLGDVGDEDRVADVGDADEDAFDGQEPVDAAHVRSGQTWQSAVISWRALHCDGGG